MGAVMRFFYVQLRDGRLAARNLPLLNNPAIMNDYAPMIKSTLLRQTRLLLILIAVAWAVEVVDWVQPWGALDWYGIHPRSLIGLPGIIFAPFLHASFGHLLANTVPFFILGWLVMVRGRQDFFTVMLAALVVSGLGVWLFGGSNTVHIGASGIVFGFLGYLLARGYYERSLAAIALAVVAVFLYGGMIWGVLPLQDGVSWLAHLFGLIGGVAAAYLLTRRPHLTRQPAAMRKYGP